MIYYILKKEFLLIFRNLHAIVVLFVMPTAFIIIMSLALQNTYSNKFDTKMNIAVLSETISLKTDAFIEKLNKNDFFIFTIVKNKLPSNTYLYKNGYDFVVFLPKDFIQNIDKDSNNSISIFSKSDMAHEHIMLLKQFIYSKIAETTIENFATILNVDINDSKNLDDTITHTYILQDKKATQVTSVQHSVPSWLIFSMFFILIPISNAFINEKNFGTLDKIRSIDVSLSTIIFGKFAPYFFMNQIQVFFMILVGMYIIPLLNGEALVINGSISLLILVSCVVSISAIAFALTIATISNSSEMATILGGTSNIILAALGGIMVPKIVMPQFMQDISELSPMSWALDCFLEVIVNGGSFSDIQNNLLKLVLFALCFFCIAYLMLKYRRN